MSLHFQTIDEAWLRANIAACERLVAGWHDWGSEHFFADRPAKFRLSFAAYCNDSLVGICIASLKDTGHMHLLAVAAQHRNQGFGREMIQELCRRLKYEGQTKLQWKVKKSNESGVRFYRRFSESYTVVDDHLLFDKDLLHIDS